MVAVLDIENALNNITPLVIDYEPSTLTVDVDFKGLIYMVAGVPLQLGTSISTRYVYRGTPLGGGLSPFLWKLELNDILVTVENGGGKVVAYGDDVVKAVKGKNPGTLRDIFRLTSTHTLSRWTGENDLAANPSKTLDSIIFNESKMKLAKSANTWALFWTASLVSGLT